MAGALALALVPGNAGAATITPDVAFDEFTLDDGECSLREAVVSANDNGDIGGCTTGDQVQGAYGTDTIVLEATNYVLSLAGGGEDDGLTGDLDIESQVTVRGPQAGTGVVNQAVADRVFDLRTAGARLTVDGATVTGGESGGLGGLINAPTAGNDIVLTDAVLDGGEALNGGAIGITGNGSSLTATDSGFTENEAGLGGGAIQVGSGVDMELTRVQVGQNETTSAVGPQLTGGAITMQSGVSDADIIDSQFEGNKVNASANDADWAHGGAIYTLSDLHVEGTLFANNSAATNGPATSDEHGGAIYVASPSDTDIVNSTFFSNDAGNSSVADEDSRGGALYKSGGGLDVSFSTFSANDATNADFADSIDNGNSGSTTTFTASVFPAGANTCEGNNISSGGFNVAPSDAECGYVGSDDIAGTASGIVVGNPADNGGPTLTFGLLPTSRAIDQVPFANCAAAGGFDARDYPRSGTGIGTACDAGAYERSTCDGVVQNDDFTPCPVIQPPPDGGQPQVNPTPQQPVTPAKKCKKAKKKKGKKAKKPACGKKKKSTKKKGR